MFEEIQACEDQCTDDTCDTGNACEERPDRAIEAAELCTYLNKDNNIGKSLKMEVCFALGLGYFKVNLQNMFVLRLCFI